MSPTEPLDQIDSSPQPPHLGRGLLVAGAVVLAMAATALTGAALADVGGGGTNDDTALAAASRSASPTAGTDEQKMPKAGKLLRRGPRVAIPGGFGALHGEFVVPDGSGGYRTVVTQRGTANEVGDSSITVRSEDGFSQTYAVPADSVVGATRDGLASIEAGDEVMVTATKKGGTLTAQLVADLDSLREHGPFGFGGPGMGGFDWRHHGPGEPPGDADTNGSTETAPTT